MRTIAKHAPSFICLLGLALGLVIAAPVVAAANPDDPPSRVARLAYAEGSVSLRPGGTDDWVAAPLNRPLTTGDSLWSDRDSRVELQLDGSALRLSGQTAVSFLNLGDHVTQIRLTAGTAIVRVRRLDDDETYEIDTPNLAFSILRPGLYRLTVDESGNTTAVAARRGQGEVTGGGSAYPVRANEYDVFSGTDELTEDADPSGGREDAFDAWSAGRDARSEHSVSARYVSPDVVGYEDLDDQGAWRPTPDYGYVWFPGGVYPGWAPYHSGHWAYVAPWGYTWVDDQPWGFAPFHYGRWVSIDGAWGWVPCPPRREGAVYARPVYAPALVAWVNVGAGVAWFALGPREVYVPSYRVSRRYVNNINVSNTTVNTTVVNNIYNTTIVNRTVNVTNVTYVNRSVPGAVAATTTQAFATAQPVPRNLVRLDEHAVARAQVRAFAPAVIPTKQAVLGPAPVAAVRPPTPAQTRTVVARTAPPARAFPARIAPRATLGLAQPPARNPETAGRPPVAVHPNEIPGTFRPPSPGIANSALERQHLQEQQRLQAQQENARQRVQQQQELEHQRLARSQADEARKQQLELRHQQQTQQLLQKHAQEQEQLQARQQQQRRQQESATKPAIRRGDPPAVRAE